VWVQFLPWCFFFLLLFPINSSFSITLSSNHAQNKDKAPQFNCSVVNGPSTSVSKVSYYINVNIKLASACPSYGISLLWRKLEISKNTIVGSERIGFCPTCSFQSPFSETTGNPNNPLKAKKWEAQPWREANTKLFFGLFCYQWCTFGYQKLLGIADEGMMFRSIAHVQPFLTNPRSPIFFVEKAVHRLLLCSSSTPLIPRVWEHWTFTAVTRIQFQLGLYVNLVCLMCFSCHEGFSLGSPLFLPHQKSTQWVECRELKIGM